MSNNKHEKYSRYIRTSKSCNCHYVRLKSIKVFAFFIGPIIGLIAGFELGLFGALSGALLGVILGYLMPFLCAGIKQWRSCMIINSSDGLGTAGCLSLFVFFLAPFLIPIFTIIYAFKGVIAIIKRDFDFIKPSSLIKPSGPIDYSMLPDP